MAPKSTFPNDPAQPIFKPRPREVPKPATKFVAGKTEDAVEAARAAYIAASAALKVSLGAYTETIAALRVTANTHSAANVAYGKAVTSFNQSLASAMSRMDFAAVSNIKTDYAATVQSLKSALDAAKTAYDEKAAALQVATAARDRAVSAHTAAAAAYSRALEASDGKVVRKSFGFQPA
jgi:hypothetical protein